MYGVDTGIRNVKGFRFSKDYGRLAENIVFIEIKRRYNSNPLIEVFYWQNKKHEVDFIVKDGITIKEAIQVCWNVANDDTKNDTKTRETEGLIAALDELKLHEGLIITEQFEGEEKKEGKKIKYIPLWKWLVEKQ